MHKVFILVLLLSSVSLRAEDFKILFINTENIQIGKVTYVAGDVFNDSEEIFWKDGRQAMKVLSLETNKQYILASEDFNQRRLKSVKDFIIKSNRLSTRGFGDLSTVASQIGNPIYWLSPTSIPINYKPDAGEYFFIKVKEQEILLEMKDGQLVFDEKIWRDGERIPIEADLYFHYIDGENILVSSGIQILPLPSELHI